MGLVEKGLRTLKDDGIRTFGRKSIQLGITKRYDLTSTNVYSRDWDILLILDGCRVDVMEAVADEYSFLGDEVESITSTGGGSPQWMANTFTSRYADAINETVYVTANPHTRRVLGPNTEGLFGDVGDGVDRLEWFDSMVPVWELAWDEDAGTVPARPVTDHLLHAYHNTDADRYIAHYMQPHFPSVPDPVGASLNLADEARWENNVWDRLASGELSFERVWESYANNLRYVLDEVSLVLENVDSKSVVLTADHGNAFGESGEYGHGQGFLREVREVPWVRTSGTGEGSYEPDVDHDSASASLDEQLEALGYR